MKNNNESALEIIKLILTKNPDSPKALELLKIDAGDKSMISISKFFEPAWCEEGEKLRGTKLLRSL